MNWNLRLERSWGHLGMKYKLSELCEYVKGKISVEALNSTNYVSTENMLPNKDGIVQATTLPSLGQTQIFKSGDVLVSNIRPYFKKIWYAQFDGGCSNDVLVFRAKERVNNRFLYYVLANDSFFDYSMATSKGTKMPRGDKSSLMKYEIHDVAYKNQEKIAEILEVLDHKIQVNKQINDNLLKQAQTIFNDFFVTFGHFGGIIPDYWEKGTLQDIVEFSNGYAFKSKELLNTQEPNSYHVFKQGHINRGGGFNSAGTKSWYPINKCTNLSKYILKKGDVLMAMTDMKDNVAILGNTALMTVDNQYIVNQRVGLLRSNKYKSSSYAYIYLLTNSFDFLKDLRSRANSGVQVNLSSSEIKSSPIWIASDEDNKEFNALVEPLLNIIMTNDIVNQKLSELRDSLLPKLMSGELDVSNINF